MADTLELLTCPACGEKMKKIYMSEAGVNIDLCLNGCGGIFFDNREFEKFDEPEESISNLVEIIGNKVFKTVDDSEIRNCPICSTPMVKMGTGIDGVEIDYCNNCATKFLDNGELLKIRQNPQEEINEKLNKLLDYVYMENFDKVTHGLAPKKSSPRRKFVEDIVKQILSVMP